MQYNGENTEQVILRDITQRKKAEQALKASEKKYRNIIELSPIGFYQTNREGRFIFTNHKMAEILGYDNANELLNRNITEFYYDQGLREKLIEKYDRKEYSEIKDLEIRFVKKVPRMRRSRFWAYRDER